MVLTTAANVISATLTVDKNNCTSSCTVNGGVSWTNDGDTPSAPTDLSLNVTGYGPVPIDSQIVINPTTPTGIYQFSIVNLQAGIYEICASPNSGTDCQTITVTAPANVIWKSVV